MKKYVLIAMVISGAFSVMAQEDGPPQEPPYIDEPQFEGDDSSIVDLPIDTLDTASEDSADGVPQMFNDEMDLAEAEEKEAPLVPIETDSKSIADEFDFENESSGTQAADSIEANDESEVAQEARELQEEIVYEPPKIQNQDNIVIERSAKGGYEFIEHPLAAKGLTEIRKDGSYVYRTGKEAESDSSGAFRFGLMDSPKITAADGTTFDMMYSEGQQPYFSFDLEWQPFKSFGLLGVSAGFGLLLAQGQGRFLDPALATQEAQEKYTFVAIPLNLGLNYRLQFTDTQILVPYATAGVSYYGVVEYRDDGKTKAVGTPGAYGGGGLLFNIGRLNRETAFTFRSEYGIANLFVSLDYKYAMSFSEDLDFSSHIIGAGIVADY